jgi:hypothetical protein
MARACWSVGIFIVLMAGCRTPPESQALRALPESRTFTYEELLQRARAQAAAAIEAFYLDGWRDLEDAGAALEQTARFLPKTTDIPASVQDRLVAAADALRRDAVQLGDSARAHDAPRTNELLQQINLKVRQLLPRESPPPSRPPVVEVFPGK